MSYSSSVSPSPFLGKSLTLFRSTIIVVICVGKVLKQPTCAAVVAVKPYQDQDQGGEYVLHGSPQLKARGGGGPRARAERRSAASDAASGRRAPLG